MSLFLTIVLAVIAGVAIKWLTGAKEQYLDMIKEDQKTD